MILRRPSAKLLALAGVLLLPACAAAPTARVARTAPVAQTQPGVVSAADPRAAAAGVEILRRGGSATDAAIATMLALNVVEPQNSGIGGGTFFVRSDAATGATATIDGRETAPRAAGPDWFLGPDGKPLPPRELMSGARSAGVPGALATMAKAHARYGKLPWADLFQPAIRLARDGFTVSARMHNGLDLYGRHVTGWAKQTYFPDGTNAIAAGATMRVPELAQTFERIAREGAGPFYRGASAERIATALSRAPMRPSPMTAGEVTAYVAKDRAPVCGTYRVYKICGMGPRS
jgi:gamma-glutamyltranspeptidase/glutathione hydrolase